MKSYGRSVITISFIVWGLGECSDSGLFSLSGLEGRFSYGGCCGYRGLWLRALRLKLDKRLVVVKVVNSQKLEA